MCVCVCVWCVYIYIHICIYIGNLDLQICNQRLRFMWPFLITQLAFFGLKKVKILNWLGKGVFDIFSFPGPLSLSSLHLISLASSPWLILHGWPPCPAVGTCLLDLQVSHFRLHPAFFVPSLLSKSLCGATWYLSVPLFVPTQKPAPIELIATVCSAHASNDCFDEIH